MKISSSIKYFSGDIYLGEWKNGKRYGQGTMTWPGRNGGSYVGGFKDGRYHGQGIMMFIE